MGHEHLGNLVTNGVHRIQGGHGLLENHGNLLSPDMAHLFFRQIQQIDALKLIRPPTIRPGGSLISPMTESTETLFPLPDSPTIPRVSPGLTQKRHRPRPLQFLPGYKNGFEGCLLSEWVYFHSPGFILFLRALTRHTQYYRQ